MKEDLVLIYSLEHSQYWRANSRGYTSDREIAGRYPRAQARAICENANKYIPPGERVNEVIEEIDLNKKSNDSISRDELREWCEEEIKNMSKRYRLGWDGALRAVIEKFCGSE